MKKNVLTKEELKNIDAYFRASNYLSVGQLYLLDNPLLKRKLTLNSLRINLCNKYSLFSYNILVTCVRR